MRLASSRQGQSLVEFALVMPLLLVMLLGIMEFGRAWHISQIVTDAARQGARAGAIYRQADSVNAAAGRVIGAGAINGCGNISACVDYSTVGDQSIVDVHVPFSFGIFGPVMRMGNDIYDPDQNFDDSGIELKSRAVMRIE
jgi:Flp pilus assembly protein TadG